MKNNSLKPCFDFLKKYGRRENMKKKTFGSNYYFITVKL